MYFLLLSASQLLSWVKKEKKKERRKRKRKRRKGWGWGWGEWNGNVTPLLESAKSCEEIQVPLAPPPLDSPVGAGPTEPEARGPLGPALRVSPAPLPPVTLSPHSGVTPSCFPARRAPQGVALSRRERRSRARVVPRNRHRRNTQTSVRLWFPWQPNTSKTNLSVPTIQKKCFYWSLFKIFFSQCKIFDAFRSQTKIPNLPTLRGAQVPAEPCR